MAAFVVTPTGTITYTLTATWGGGTLASQRYRPWKGRHE